MVIDPGHGGEDGGAVSPGGVQESHINLAVSKQLRDLLRFAGVPTAMTREEDVTICDEGLGTIRARKASDIRNRVAIVNGTENAVLLSIHQNSLPSSTVMVESNLSVKYIYKLNTLLCCTSYHIICH